MGSVGAEYGVQCAANVAQCYGHGTSSHILHKAIGRCGNEILSLTALTVLCCLQRPPLQLSHTTQPMLAKQFVSYGVDCPLW